MNQPQIPLSDVLRYISAPKFLAKRQRVDAVALRHLVQLLFLCLFILLVLSGLVGAIVSSVSGSVPENANQALGESNPLELILMGVLLAPIIEELVFRSWLSGKRASVLGLPILASAAAVFASVGMDPPPVVSFGLATILGLLIILVARQYASRTDDENAAARQRLFPFAFYGSTILFALTHLSNYEGGLSSPILLLAVLPQAIVGLLLAYVRMRFGLLSAILFHAAYNGVLIGLFLMAQALEPSGDVSGAAQIMPSALQALVGRGLPA